LQTERNKILKYINRPYPIQILDKYIWWDTFGIALIIAIAINLLQPFGMNELHINYKYLLLSGFGVIYAFVNILYYLSFEKFFKNHKWTVKNEIVASLVLFFIAGIFNWLYAISWIPAFSCTYISFLKFQYYTLVFGALPVVFFSLFIENRNLKNSIKYSELINSKIEKQVCKPENKTLQLNGYSINTEQILYFNSYQNYVDIYIVQEDKLTTLLLRYTFKQLLIQLADYPFFIQCHKSYIVNKNKIVKTEGNSQGLLLYLDNCKNTIPVSRSYINVLKNQFTNSN